MEKLKKAVEENAKKVIANTLQVMLLEMEEVKAHTFTYLMKKRTTEYTNWTHVNNGKKDTKLVKQIVTETIKKLNNAIKTVLDKEIIAVTIKH